MISEDRIFRLDKQILTLHDFQTQGLILDIGGGGEGVIGQLKGTQVVAIDVFRTELAEAPEGPLKIIMDAREMKFLDATFKTITAFFSLMFIHPDDHARVLQEIFRVLTPNGQFLFWDIEIPQRPEPHRDMAVFQLQVQLPSTIINTGYGTPYTERPIRMENYIQLAKQAGLQLIEQSFSGQTFFCKFHKPLR